MPGGATLSHTPSPSSSSPSAAATATAGKHKAAKDSKALEDLFSCIGAGDVATAGALLDAKEETERVALLAATNPSGITLLMHACHTGKAEGVSMLLDKGADPSWTSTKGSTPLHFACNTGHFDCASRLLKAGVDVNAGNSNGTTPLIISAFGAHTSCVKLLLEHGADPDVRDNLGRRAGDSLCGVGIGATGVAGTSGQQPFLETRSLLAKARAAREQLLKCEKQRSEREGSVALSCASAVGRPPPPPLSARADTSSCKPSSTGASCPINVTSATTTLSPTGATSGCAENEEDAAVDSAGACGGRIRAASVSITGVGDNRDGRAFSDPTVLSTWLPCGGGRSGSGPLASGEFSSPPPLSSSSSSARQCALNLTSPSASSRGAGSRRDQVVAGSSPLPGSSAPSPSSSSSVPPPFLSSPMATATTSSPSPMTSPMTSRSTPAAPEFDHPRRLLNPKTYAMELKAALAANAAHRRSLTREEDSYLEQRDEMERQRGQAGGRRRGAEEQAALLRAQADALARGEDTNMRSHPSNNMAAPTMHIRQGSLGRLSGHLSHSPQGSASGAEGLGVTPQTLQGPSPSSSHSSSPHLFATSSSSCGASSSAIMSPGTALPIPAFSANDDDGDATVARIDGREVMVDDAQDARDISPSQARYFGDQSLCCGDDIRDPCNRLLRCDRRDDNDQRHHHHHRRHHAHNRQQQYQQQQGGQEGAQEDMDGYRTTRHRDIIITAPASLNTTRNAGMHDDDPATRTVHGRLLDAFDGQRRLVLHPTSTATRGNTASNNTTNKSNSRTTAASDICGDMADGVSSMLDEAAAMVDEGAEGAEGATMLHADRSEGSFASREACRGLGGRRAEGGQSRDAGRDGGRARNVRLVEAQSRCFGHLEAEPRLPRRDNRDGRSERYRSRTNANKRQRAGTGTGTAASGAGPPSLEPASCLSGGRVCRRNTAATAAEDCQDYTSEDDSNHDTTGRSEARVENGIRSEVRRLRAEAAALGREHASLAAQHAALVLEKARQAGALRHRVANADGEVGRLSTQLKEAKELLEAKLQEEEEWKKNKEGLEQLAHNHAQELQQALDRLESIGMALARERSINTHRRHSDTRHPDHTDNVGTGDGHNSNNGNNSIQDNENGRDNHETVHSNSTPRTSDANSNSVGAGDCRVPRVGGEVHSEVDGVHDGAPRDVDSHASGADNADPSELVVTPLMVVDTDGDGDGDADGGTPAHDNVDATPSDDSNAGDTGSNVDNNDGGIPMGTSGDNSSGDSDSAGSSSNNNNSNSDTVSTSNTQDNTHDRHGDVARNISDSRSQGRVEGGAMTAAANMDDAGVGSAQEGAGPGGTGEQAAGAGAAVATEENLPMARIFSHQQVDAACAGFPDSGIVGRGGFGPVFRGRFLGQEVAVKRLDGYGLQGLPNFLKEVQVLTTCRHEHLVPLLGICLDPTPMLVYPFVGQSLEWHMREPQRRERIGWRTRLAVALAVTKGLQYLHEPQPGAWGKPAIVHRDVKAENILMDSNLKARLSDVGIARQLDRGGAGASTRLIGTWGYIDPEYQESGVLTPSSDVFGLGVVFLELLTGSPAHSAELRPPSLVDRVNGKQLSECLDPSCSWPDTAAVVSFAKEAWQCVSRRGDDRPRLPHLIQRLERLPVGEEPAATRTASASAGVSRTQATQGTSAGAATLGDQNVNPGEGLNAEGVAGDTARPTPGPPPPSQQRQQTVGQQQQPTPPSNSSPPLPSGALESQPPASAAMLPLSPPPSAPRVAVESPTARGQSAAPPAHPSPSPPPSAAAAAAAAARAAAVASAAAMEAAAAARAAAEARDREDREMGRATPAAHGAQGPQGPGSVAESVPPAGAGVVGGGGADGGEDVEEVVVILPRAPAPSAPVGRDCMICASAPVQTRFLPCHHSLACLNCASLLRARGDRCPVDRARIVSFETGQFQVTYSGT